jgi:hypothetical protein
LSEIGGRRERPRQRRPATRNPERYATFASLYDAVAGMGGGSKLAQVLPLLTRACDSSDRKIQESAVKLVHRVAAHVVLSLPLSPPPCLFHCVPHRVSLTVSPSPSLSHCVSHCAVHCVPHRVSLIMSPSPSLSHCVSHCAVHCVSHRVSPTVSPSPSLAHWASPPPRAARGSRSSCSRAGTGW